jgi:hypothetical protein
MAGEGPKVRRVSATQMTTPVRVWAVAVACVIMTVLVAGCASPGTSSTAVPGSIAGVTSTVPVSTTAGISTAAEAVAAAMRWTESAPTKVSTSPNGASSPTEAKDGLFDYTYSADGQTGRVESLTTLREPLVPFPLSWTGDTYFLSTENFSIAGVGRPGLAADIEGIKASLDSSVHRWNELGDYLGFAIAGLRIRDPLRVLKAFTPDSSALPVPGADDSITLEGTVDKRVLVASDVLVNAANLALGSNANGPQSLFLPEEMKVSLTIATADWRPVELRFGGLTGTETAEIVARWQRADRPPAVPEGYISLLDYVRPAADDAALLAKSAAWMEAQPLAVSYPDGSALLDEAAGLFQIVDLPGRGGWGGAFPDETTAGRPIKKGSYSLWPVDQPSSNWVSADQLDLHKAVESVFSVPPAKRDPEKADAVYRAVMRAFLLDVLDPHWWVEEMQASMGEKYSPDGTGMTVSKTAAGYAVEATLRDEQLFPPLEHYTSLIVTLGNPPSSIAKYDTGDRPWNYTQEYALTLETDGGGVPLSLTLVSNATAGFALLQSLRMTFERTTQTVAAPEDGSTLAEYLKTL